MTLNLRSFYKNWYIIAFSLIWYISFRTSFFSYLWNISYQFLWKVVKAIVNLYSCGKKRILILYKSNHYIGSRTISPGQFPLGSLLYCPRIITPWQLLPTVLTVTNYNFFIAIFCLFPMSQLYNFCYHNKNNNDNRNKTWSLKLLSVIKLQH